MKKTHYPLWFCVLLLPLLTGCPYHEYVLDLTPGPGGLHRSLTCSRQERSTNAPVQRQEFPAPELQSIAACYPGDAHTVVSNVHTFSAIFPRRLPSDLDGWGQYSSVTSSVGSAHFYLERFRGSTNLQTQLKDRLAAVDEITDLVIGWMHREVGKSRGYSHLKKTLDQDFRRDFKELSLEWLLKGEQNESDLVVLLTRRGYLPEEQPWGIDSPLALVAMNAFLQRQLGTTDPTLPLPFLGTPGTLEASASNYLASTAQHKRLLKEWKSRGSQGEAPKPDAILESLFERAFYAGSRSDKGADELTVKLHLPVEPVATNGKWDAAENAVVWKLRQPGLSPEYTNPADNAQAAWCEPDTAFQTRHFGRVLIEGQALIDYCQWYQLLKPGQKTEWDAVLATTQPGKHDALKTFRFRDESAAGITEGREAVVRDL